MVLYTFPSVSHLSANSLFSTSTTVQYERCTRIWPNYRPILHIARFIACTTPTIAARSLLPGISCPPACLKHSLASCEHKSISLEQQSSSPCSLDPKICTVGIRMAAGAVLWSSVVIIPCSKRSGFTGGSPEKKTANLMRAAVRSRHVSRIIRVEARIAPLEKAITPSKVPSITM
jgi:hypothetical protein